MITVTAARKQIDSCLKKSSNSDLRIGGKGATSGTAAETHLLICQKNQISGSTASSLLSPTSLTGPAFRSSKFDHNCGYLKCNSDSGVGGGGAAAADCVISSSASSASSCNLPGNSVSKRCTCGGSDNSKSFVIEKSPVLSSRLVQVKKKILKTSSSSAMFSRSNSMHDARSVSSSLDSSIGGGGGVCYEDPIEMKRIRDRIAQADVFLEAIGNASTITNYNSSRYVSKFILIVNC